MDPQMKLLMGSKPEVEAWVRVVERETDTVQEEKTRESM